MTSRQIVPGAAPVDRAVLLTEGRRQDSAVRATPEPPPGEWAAVFSSDYMFGSNLYYISFLGKPDDRSLDTVVRRPSPRAEHNHRGQ